MTHINYTVHGVDAAGKRIRPVVFRDIEDAVTFLHSDAMRSGVVRDNGLRGRYKVVARRPVDTVSHYYNWMSNQEASHV